MKKIKIGDVCDILNGYAFKSENYVDSGIRIIRISNVQKGYIEDSTPAFYSFDTMGLSKFMLEEGDLLMSLTGNVGRVAILEKELLPAALNQRVACLRLKSNKITKSYLFHFLNSNFFEQQCIMASNGVAQKNMSTEWLKDYEIPLYTLNQQEEIVTVLNAAQSILSSRRQQLQKLDELVKVRFVELFGDPLSNDKGWQKVLITEVCHAIFGGGTPSKSHPEYFTGSIPWVSPKDMKSLVINDSIDHITEKAIAHSTTNLVPANSVLMVIRSGILKHTLPVAVNSLPVTINQDMKAFVPNDTVKTAFLMYFFKAIENDVLADVRGVTADNIDFKAFQKRTIIVPPLALQEQFAAFVTQADKSKVAIQKALDEAQLLFDSLMQKYFG